MNLNWIKEIKDLDLSGNKYSQTGEEIILQYIFSKIGKTNRFLVDFGAGDGFALSNTQRLLENGWEGLRMDADNRGNAKVKKEFITPHNILDLFVKHKVPFDFDLLSVDMDSCDFDVICEILACFYPRVICCEYNPAFQPHESKYLAYEAGYTWDGTTKYGFSFQAGRKLMAHFDYSLIYNQEFLNLFFIHNSIMGELYLDIPNERKIFHPVNNNVQWVQY